jgi:Flp pilus assembly protein protease CpaA
MLGEIFLIVLGTSWLVFASAQDLKSREVANWVSFSLILFAMGFRFFSSLFSGDWNFLLQGILGLGIFFILGNLFYYSRMFAGGDAKLLIAIGAVLPLSQSFLFNLKFFGIFLFLFLFVGGVYGLFWSFILGFKNKKEFKKEFKKRFFQNKSLVFLSFIFGFIFIFWGVFSDIFLIYFGFLFFLFPILAVYSRVIEEVCMIKKINTSKLSVGDWLYKDVKLKRKKIKFHWEGLDEEQIRDLKKERKFVYIKQGIPFIPVFLISYLVLIFLEGYFFEILSF